MNRSQMLLNAARQYADLVIHEMLKLRGYDTIYITDDAVCAAFDSMDRQQQHFIDGFDKRRPAAITAALIVEDDLKYAN